MTNQKDIKTIAAEYAALGLSVIPLRPKGKEPLSKGWQKKAASDPEEAKKLFRGRDKTDCNIGAATGAAFGLAVLDLDKHSENADGEKSLKSYLEEHGETLPETWTARTGSGGKHIYFRTETPVRKRVGILPGVDVCGEGGFCVLPPSVHQNGKRYQWIKGHSPDDLPLAKLPAFLADLFGNAGNLENIENVEKIIEGGRNDAIFKKAASLRAQGYTKAEILAALKAFNADRCKPPLSEKEVKTICESAGKYERGKKKSVPPLDYHSARELQGKDLPPLKWVLVDMIPQGLTLLASPPKYGKSWWVLDLCLSVAAGTRFMEHSTIKSGALYLALEDSENRLQGRIDKLTYGDPAPSAFDYATTAANLDEGLTDQLEAYLQEKPETGLIVIDTLQMIRGETGSRESAYASDYRQISLLKQFADKHGVSLVVVHHLRKGKGDGDPFERISGTSAIFGSADAALVMQREKRQDKETKLHITGRDVTPDDLALEFDPASCRWKCKGSLEEIEERRLAEEYDSDPIVRTIKHLLKDSPIWTGTATDLAAACFEFTGEPIDTEIRTFGKKIRTTANMMWARDEIYYSYANGGRKGRKHTFKKYGKPKK